jgi:dihydrofolate synthase/folylpolyglutamate synthase
LREIPETLDVRRTGADGTTWIDPTTGAPRTIALGGTFQSRNGATAVAAVETLAAGGFAIPDHAYASGLAQVRIPGRIELIRDQVPVMLDGAHNPEKVAALARDVPQLLPKSATSRRIAIVGVLEAKQADEMFRNLVPVVDVIIATSPQVLAKEPRHAGEIEAIARAASFSGSVFVEPEPLKAIETALAQVRDDAGDAILVTGSLYLVGNIRSRWYDEQSIVLQQTSWPTAPRTAPHTT